MTDSKIFLKYILFSNGRKKENNVLIGSPKIQFALFWHFLTFLRYDTELAERLFNLDME